MTSRLPPLLEQYLALPPEAALVVLSGVVGASTNWLVLRYMASFLGRSPPPPTGAGETDGDDTAVLLVSFMRDFSFWRVGAGRLGVDLDALRRRGRFGFVDGLTGLFSSDQAAPPTNGPQQQQQQQQPHRTLAWNSAQGMRGIGASLLEALESLQQGGEGSTRRTKKPIVVIVDQPDLLLAAATGGTSGGAAEDLRGVLLDVRERAHAAVVAVSADGPLVAAGQQQQQQRTALERAHASLALSLAHEADLLLCLRLLDTGTANDVGGVVRVTRGGGGGGGGGGAAVEEHEYLYHVGGDGGVRVFERGQ
ncbi:hypothetical protein RB596_001588 [Gaeumannomyces avenae]